MENTNRIDNTDRMEKYIEGHIIEYVLLNGDNKRAVLIWDTEWEHYMDLFYSKKRISWICKGFTDDCKKTPTECKHAELLNNIPKNKKINGIRDLVRSKCDFCNIVFISKDNYKEIKLLYTNYSIKEPAEKLYNETLIEILFLKCGHICHKICYDGYCNICDIKDIVN